jgi:NADH dehydrogenase FAD-containing subunit
MHGELQALDIDHKKFKLKGVHQPISFDKFLLACGAYKRRLEREFSNVFYLEDR